MDQLLNGQKRFGIMTVVGEGAPRVGKNPWPLRMALCRCDCGEERDCQPAKLKRGDHQSCGCQARAKISAAVTRHGLYKHPLYSTWNGMMQRCHNEKDAGYPSYGGRGIKVCDEWQGHDGLRAFIAYMPPKPRGYSIDRIDVNGNYEPGNVRWADDKFQMNNRRVSKPITFNGETRNARDWAAHLGLSKNTIDERLKRGWPIERALTEGVKA